MKKLILNIFSALVIAALFLFPLSLIPSANASAVAADVKVAAHTLAENVGVVAAGAPVAHPYELTLKILEHYKQKYPKGCPDNIDEEVEKEFFTLGNRFAVYLAATLLQEEHLESHRSWHSDLYIKWCLLRDCSISLIEARIIENIKVTPLQFRNFAFRSAIEVFQRSPELQRMFQANPTDITKLPLGVSAAQVLAHPELEVEGFGRDFASRLETATYTYYKLHRCMITHMGDLEDSILDNTLSSVLPLIPDCIDIVKNYLPLIRMELFQNLIQEINVHEVGRLASIELQDNLLGRIQISGSVPYLRSIDCQNNFLYEIAPNLFVAAPALYDVDIGEYQGVAIVAPRNSKWIGGSNGVNLALRRIVNPNEDTTKSD